MGKVKSGRAPKARLTPVEKHLRDLWRQAITRSNVRVDALQTTLALALKLDPQSSEHRNFAAEVWLSLGTRSTDHIPPPPRDGLTAWRALLVAKRLERLSLCKTGAKRPKPVLRVPQTITLAEFRRHEAIEKAVKSASKPRDPKDSAIAKAAKSERGAVATYARSLGISPQHAGRLVKAHKAGLLEIEQEQLRKSLMARLRERQ